MERLVPNPCIPNFDFFDKINTKIMKYLLCPNGDIGDTSLLYTSARSPTKVTSMAPLMASSLTVLVVQQGKTDGPPVCCAGMDRLRRGIDQSRR